MRDLRIGVVGVGQRAALARHAHRPAAGSRIVACADPAVRGQAYARELFGSDVHVHADYESLLDNGLDAVMVFTPDDQHTEPVLAALRRGVAVFVEKPIAISLADCDHILTTAHETGTRLYVGHNLRHLPALRKMRRLIDDGVIGEVKAVWCRHFVGHGGDFYFKDWHAERRHTLSLLLQKGAHDLDVIHWLAGGVSRQVVAMGELAVYNNPQQQRRGDSERPAAGQMSDWFDPGQWPPTDLRDLNPIIDVEDISMMLARLSNGVLASYQQCHFTPDYWRNYTVIGDAGRMENFGDALTGGTAEIRVWNKQRFDYRTDADLSLPIESTAGSHGGADEAMIAEFLRFILDGGPTDTSPVAAREAVAAGAAAAQSLRTGAQPVEIAALNPDIVAYFAAGQPSSSPATT